MKRSADSDSASKRQRSARTSTSSQNAIGHGALVSPASSTGTFPPSPSSATPSSRSPPVVPSPTPLPGHVKPTQPLFWTPTPLAATTMCTPLPVAHVSSGEAAGTAVPGSDGVAAAMAAAVAAAKAGAAAATARGSKRTVGNHAMPGPAALACPTLSPPPPTSAPGATAALAPAALAAPRSVPIISPATAAPAPLAAQAAPRAGTAAAASPASSIPPAVPVAAPEATVAAEHQGDSARVNIIADLLSATMTITHETPLSATIGSIASHKDLSAQMDVDSKLPPDADEMLSTAMGLQMSRLTLSDDVLGEDGEKRTQKVAADAAFARAVTAMRRERSEELWKARMDLEEEEADAMDVEEQIEVEVVKVDRMAKRRQEEMRAILNDGRGRRSRRRISAVLAKTRVGGGAQSAMEDRCSLSLREKWKEGKLSIL